MIKQQRVKKRRITLPSPALPSPTSIIPSFKQQPLPEEHSIKRRRTTPKKNNANTESSSIGKYKERNVFKSMEKQQEFMEELFYKLSFARMEEWLSLSSNKFIQHGGKRLVITQYKRDMKTLLSSIYPNYCWEFDNRKQTSPPLSSLNNQQKRMEELFVKLKLQRMEDWVKVKRRTFNKSGGKQLLLLYNRNFQTLLLSLYPNYPWHYHCNLLSSNLPSLSPNPPSNLPSLSFNLVPKEHFQSIENQREFMHQLFIKYSLKTIDDWLSFSRHKIIQNGGRSLLNYYKGDFSLLLQCIYPNYPMEDIKSLSLKFKSHHYFRSKENQREFMHHLYNKLKLKSLNHWLKVKTKIIKENGGKGLMEEYSDEIEKLLLSLYPNYPWPFSNEKNQMKLTNLFDKNLEIERNKMDQLFIELNLKSMEEWFSVSKTKLIKKGVKILEEENIFDYLLRIYPNYGWDYSSLLSFYSKSYFKSIENQREFMDNLFIKLNLKSIDDWKNGKEKIIKKNGGKRLLKIYSNDMKKLLSTIYPKHSWNFLDQKNDSNEEEIIRKNLLEHRKRMDQLFIKFNLKSFDDWLVVSKTKMIKRGGKEILKLYNGNMFNILQNVYPNYPWDISFTSNLISSKLYFKSIENQRKFMDNLFIKFNLKSIDDWFNLSLNEIKKNGGKRLLKIYSNDMKKLVQNLYVKYPWRLIDNQKKQKNLKIRKVKLSEKDLKTKLKEEHGRIMDQLFIKFKLNTLSDWLLVSKTRIENSGGTSMLLLYRGNLIQLLQNIYPNYPWLFSISSTQFPTFYFKSRYFQLSIENQREFMDHLFIKLNFQTLDNWFDISLKVIKKNGGKGLLKLYQNDKKILLQTLYPNYLWDFNSYRYSFTPHIIEWIIKYNITQKKDWYRLRQDFGLRSFELYETLCVFYTTEKWKKSDFQITSKRTTQRLLFSFTQMIYPQLLIFEDYYHPHLNESFQCILDVFIPALQLALEYQGEQHYDDIPGAFGPIEVRQGRDVDKEKMAKDHSIKIIYIPYWWDHSLSSLQSSLLSP